VIASLALVLLSPALQTPSNTSADEWIAKLRRGDWAERTMAAAMIGSLGPGAKAAVPALAAALDDRDAPGLFRGTVATTLARLGPEAREAVPALLRVLRDDDPERAEEDSLWDQARANTAYALGQVGAADRGSIVPALLEVAPRTRGNLRNLCLSSLETLGLSAADAATAVPVLIRILEEWKEGVAGQRSAAVLLGQIGPSAKASLPALDAACDSRDEGVRQAAQQALRKIREN